MSDHHCHAPGLTIDRALTEILLRGDWCFKGSLTLGPDLPTPRCNARFEKVEDGIVVWIDPVDENEAILVEHARLGEADLSSAVSKNAALEGATLEAITVQVNRLIGEDLIEVIHSSAPVVVRASTVAGRGEAASLSPEGRLS